MNFRELIVGRSRRTAHVYRFSSLPVTRRENVAEHSYFVAFYALLIANDLELRSNPPEESYVIDKGELVKRALVHDLEESLSGDFLRIFKYRTSQLREEIAKASEELLTEIAMELGDEEIVPLWKNAKDDSIEGQIIAFADLLTVIAYVLEEIQCGNRHLEEVLNETVTHFQHLKESRNRVFRIYGEALREVVLGTLREAGHDLEGRSAWTHTRA